LVKFNQLEDLPSKLETPAFAIIEFFNNQLALLSGDKIEFWDLSNKPKRVSLMMGWKGLQVSGATLTDSRDVPKMVVSEDSRILRIWEKRKYAGRIITKHNDTINVVLKVPGKHMLISGSKDGALKCIVGKRVFH